MKTMPSTFLQMLLMVAMLLASLNTLMATADPINETDNFLGTQHQRSRAVIYVNSTATGNNNGSSWSNAYTSLQSALNAAVSGDQIWVARGTYKPSTDYGLSTEPRYYHFRMINGVGIFGGFAGSESSVDQRSDYQIGEINQTILSGDLAGNDVWDVSFFDPWNGGYKNGSGSENCYHVIYNVEATALDSTAVLDGFTITGGNANFYWDASPHTNGGAMYNEGVSPTIKNCTFTKNQAYAVGDGGECPSQGSCIFGIESNPIISDCLFIDNFTHTATISLVGGGLTMTNCTLTRNNSWQRTPNLQIAQNVYPSSITNCTFSYNNGQVYGVALYLWYAESVTVSGCSFVGNTSSYYYYDSSAIGVVCNIGSNNISYDKCSFVSNDVTNVDDSYGKGGAIYNGSYCSNIQISNCVFSKNKAAQGGAICNSASSCTVTNSTFSENTATVSGGASACWVAFSWANNASGYITYNNCAFWGNTSPSGNEIFCSGADDAGNHCVTEINYSCFPNDAGDVLASSGGEVIATNSNLHMNPLFFNPAENDLRLTSVSPCRNAGSNTYNTALTDIRGNDRIQGGVIDMGAYEWTESSDPFHVVIYVKHDATGNNDGTSWVNAFTSFQSALDTATANHDIYIAKGTYKPTSAYSLTNSPRFYHFELKNGVNTYGGFAGTESSIEQRVHFGSGEENETILSGDLGNIGDYSDNCYHIIYNPASGISNTTVLNGVTISGGNANGTNPHNRGGGIYLHFASPTFIGVTIKGNQGNYGGGAFNHSASPLYINCLLIQNHGNTAGGGMRQHYATSTVTNCSFINNTAGSTGGGVDNNYSTSTYNNCIIWGNTATTGNQIYNTGNGITTLNYSCCANGTNDVITLDVAVLNTSNNNISTNPVFIDAVNNDFRLFGFSPCVNSGFNSANTTALDIRGKLRIQDLSIDMGAFEWTAGYDPYQIAAPNLRIWTEGGNLYMEWDPVPHATGYKIFSSDSPDGVFTLLDSTPVPFWNCVIIGEKRFFQVRSIIE
jgi:hypothetical protein